jgi:hypothetical protein
VVTPTSPQVVDRLPEASLGGVIVRDPPLVGAGPCPTQHQAKRQAATANERVGGPGFFVEGRDGDVNRTPHAYFAERSSSGQWYAVLKEMPTGPMGLASVLEKAS